MSSAKSPPPTIAGFTFTESIGAGGFADVFLFTQHSTGRPVAVKVLRAEHLSDHSRRQFETEANVMAGVSAHPFIVTIHDAGVASDGRPFLVMEHYPLPHFGRRAAGGALSTAEVLRVAVQVSSAVETAHRAGILHRDIKPANILTSAYGDPGLTDFGIAGVQTDGTMSAAAGVTIGFTAPEVIFDDHSTGSRSSDVFAMGATVYALLTGRSPLWVPGGDNSESALTRRLEKGEVPAFGRDDVPRSLEHLVRSALAPQANQRPGTAEEFARALQDIEQELHLPPTNLVLTGQVQHENRPRTSGDSDGTRRRPKIVRIDEQAPRIPDEPVFAAPAHDPVADDRTTARPGLTRDGDTIARTRHDHEGLSGAPDPSIAMEPGRRRIPVAVMAGAGSVVVVLIVIALVMATGSSKPTDDSQTTRPSTIPDDPIGFASIEPPGAPSLVVEPDGSGTLTWTAPTSVPAGKAVTYSVFRTDGPAITTILDEGSATTLEVPATALTDPDGEVCFKVRASVLSTSNSSEACFDAIVG